LAVVFFFLTAVPVVFLAAFFSAAFEALASLAAFSRPFFASALAFFSALSTFGA